MRQKNNLRGSTEPGLFMVSAACPKALSIRVKQLKAILETSEQNLTVGDVAIAISRRWDGMNYRASFFGTTQRDVIEQIDAFLISATRLKNRARIGTTVGLPADRTGWEQIARKLPTPLNGEDINVVFKKLGLQILEQGGDVLAVTNTATKENNHISLAQTDDIVTDMFTLVGRLWERGVRVDHATLWSCGAAAVPLDVPGYPFQRSPAWNLPQDPPNQH